MIGGEFMFMGSHPKGTTCRHGVASRQGFLYHVAKAFFGRGLVDLSLSGPEAMELCCER